MESSSTPPGLFLSGVQDKYTAPPKDIYIKSGYSPEVAQELVDTANALVWSPSGIYATDEATKLMDDLLINLGSDPNASAEEKKEKRKLWRECMYKAADPEYISGVILAPETLMDFELAPILTKKGIIPGVRAHGDPIPFPNSPSEYTVEGLDDLLTSLKKARKAGARFAKWRCPIACTSTHQGLPSQIALEVQAEILGRFACISQQAGLVPIVEPDVEYSEDADLARSAEVHQNAISAIYARCTAHGVLLEGSLLKPSFPQPGLQNPSRNKVTAEEIALATCAVLARSVPVSVAGVAFLSGGLAPSTAVDYLRAVNEMVKAAEPPSAFGRLASLTFSYGRALQGEAMEKWVKGDEEGAQKALSKWSKKCSDAAASK